MSTDRPEESDEDESLRRDDGPFELDPHYSISDDANDYAGNIREEIISKVRTPAMLMFFGGIVSTLSSVFRIISAPYADPAGPQNGGEMIGYVDAGVGLLGVLLFGLATVGAAFMRNLRHHRLAITSAIILSSSVFCVSLWGFFISPIAIWALIVLFDPKVDREFKQVQREWTNDAQPRS